MECLKCGRETAGNEVFCSECLKEMEKNPVPSNTPVVLHNRAETPRKAVHKKTQKQDVVIDQLHKQIHRLHIWVTVLVILLVAALGALGYGAWAMGDELDLGSNYSSITSASEAPLQ